MPVAALFDHEEVGSETAYGAHSGFLPRALERMCQLIAMLLIVARASRRARQQVRQQHGDYVQRRDVLRCQRRVVRDPGRRHRHLARGQVEEMHVSEVFEQDPALARLDREAPEYGVGKYNAAQVDADHAVAVGEPPDAGEEAGGGVVLILEEFQRLLQLLRCRRCPWPLSRG